MAAFSNPDEAGLLMEELKLGRKEGLIGIIDAAVVVKDQDGNLKVTDARRRSRRVKGFVTGGVIGGLVGLLAGPVGWAALGGGAVGLLAQRARSAPVKNTMEAIGESLTPNSSAIVAVVEHTWIARLETELAAEGARVVSEIIAADIAEQLQQGGNVLYSVGAGADSASAVRIVENDEGVRASGFVTSDEGVLIADALLTDEELEDEGLLPDAG